MESVEGDPMYKTWRFVAVAVAVILVFPAAASAAIRIHKIRYDPWGADYTSNKQLRAEYIVVKNTGSKARQLRRWVVREQRATASGSPAMAFRPEDT